MSCAHAFIPAAGGEGLFSVDASALTFGRGALNEVGAVMKQHGCARIAVFTDPAVGRLEHVAKVRAALGDAAVVFDQVKVEPTGESFLEAARFAKDGRFDGYVSIGGGSVIDTCKAAILFATYPAELLTYVNKPVGAGQPVPGPLPVHIACPTTSGTGSELTGIAVCDVGVMKTGIASRRLRPTAAIIDPDTTRTLPAGVVAASGFDVLCHAIESYTARPFQSRARPDSPAARQMSQGRNPWSDLGSLEALKLCARFIERATLDAADDEAREGMMWAATLAGLAFGNAGVHLPHAMAYAVAGKGKDFRMPGYESAFVPHGVSVVMSAPEAFRFVAPACVERHREVSTVLGDDVSTWLERTMEKTGVPVGLGRICKPSDVADLVTATDAQRRLLDNAPCPISAADLKTLFEQALS